MCRQFETQIHALGANVKQEIAGCRHAEQAEGQTLVCGLRCPPIVALPNRREELVGRERQGAHDIDLIYEERDLTRAIRQNHIADRRLGFGQNHAAVAMNLLMSN